MATLTSANSKLTLSVRSFLPIPQSIQGYAVDESVTVSDVNPTQVVIGVDGRKSSGYTPYLVPMTIMLQADSPSMEFFNTVIRAMGSAMEDFIFDGTVYSPSLNA